MLALRLCVCRLFGALMGHLKRAKVVLERDQSVIGKQESRLQEAAKKDETDRIKLREEQSNAFREKKQKDVDVGTVL